MRKSQIRSVWVEQGLVAPRLALVRGQHAQIVVDRGKRLRSSFERLGGLFAAFGHYVGGRSDLLSSTELSELRQIPIPFLGSSSIDTVPVDPQRLRNPVSIGNLAFSRIFRGSYGDRSVIVEVFDPVSPVLRSRAWSLFEKGIRALRKSSLGALCQKAVLDDFHHWLTLQGDSARKRRILETLQEVPPGCVVRVPALIPELQDERILAYELIPGDDSVGSMEPGSPETSKWAQQCCEFFLESSLFLGVVPATSRAEDLLATGDGGITPLFWPAQETVPAELTFEFLQYVTSAVAGDQSRALQMLSRLGGNVPGGFDEERVRDQLSAQHGDLEVELTLPASARSLDDLWKALMKSGFEAPSFLSLFHGHVLMLGRFNSRYAPAADLMSDSIWPVLGRVLRLQMGETVSVQKTREWIAGSTLSFLGMFRQFGMMMEQLRANDLSVSIRMDHDGNGAGSRRGNASTVIAGLVTLAVFLVALQTAFTGSGSAAMMATVLVALSGVGLFFSLSRLS